MQLLSYDLGGLLQVVEGDLRKQVMSCMALKTSQEYLNPIIIAIIVSCCFNLMLQKVIHVAFPIPRLPLMISKNYHGYIES